MEACEKIAFNVRLSRNVWRLSHAEYCDLTKRAGLTEAIWLPASGVQGKSCAPGPLYRGAQTLRLNFGLFYKFNLVSYCRLQTRTFWSRPRFRFIHEIMVENRPYDRTTMHEEILNGRRIPGMRAAGSGTEKLLVDDASKLVQYYDGCLALAESIRRKGLRDAPNEASSITVAIDQNGRFLHLSKGNHRLAIAMVLGIERIPVRVRYINGEYFARFADRRRGMSAPRLLAAISESVAAAAKQARAVADVPALDVAVPVAPDHASTPHEHVRDDVTPASVRSPGLQPVD